jgi:predicted amidohydrolase YtcJ
VTQPNFIAERGDQYLRDIPPDEYAQLWRVASLMDAGIPVAASTDAPFGASDPWAAMRAAVTRMIGPAERVGPRQALQMFLGWADRPALARTIAVGEPGDMCILAVPPSDALGALASDMVVATVVGGELVPAPG